MMNSGCQLIILTVSDTSLSETPFFRSLQLNNYTDCLVKLTPQNKQSAKICKIRQVLNHIRVLRSDSLVLFSDAFDVFFRLPARDVVERFNTYKKSIVFSSEIWFSHQNHSHRHYFDSLSSLENRYFNSGLYIGKAAALTQLLEKTKNSPYLSMKPVHDQAALSDVIYKFGFDHFDSTLDYSEKIFYTAAGRWSLSLTNKNVRARNPAAVHFPFTAAPRIKNTFRAAFSSYVSHPWPEEDFEFCKKQEKICKTAPNEKYCHIGPGHRPGLNRVVC